MFHVEQNREEEGSLCSTWNTWLVGLPAWEASHSRKGRSPATGIGLAIRFSRTGSYLNVPRETFLPGGRRVRSFGQLRGG